jgi:hypothetical protein
VINNEIHITYRVNDLSGKSEIGIDLHISVSNGKKIKRKKIMMKTKAIIVKMQ